MTDSFWNIPDVAKLKTPLSMMREQAAELGKKTDGLLESGVNVNPSSGDTTLVNLYIKVPRLNNYMYLILSYHQPITLYPGIFIYTGDAIQIPIKNDDDFMEGLKMYLSDQKTANIIKSLLAQAMQA